MSSLDVDVINFNPLKSSKELLSSYLDFMDRIFLEIHPEEDPSFTRKQREKTIQRKD